ncbi:MAG: hypothetical protein INH41_13555 [Myxococcaceae bacterium]|jgi:hypothetical protein|nr:hypothetical protein [Myxococcaceae bacterium]
MNDTDRQLAELKAELHRISLANRRRSRLHLALFVGAGLSAAGVVLAQPALTTFNADEAALASAVNANFSQVATFTVPRGGIIFFDGISCPPGWTQVAQGRAIVGRPAAGTNGQAFGTALSNDVEPNHAHTLSPAGAHSHGGETGSFSNWAQGPVNWIVQVGSQSPWHHRHSISSDGEHSHPASSVGAGSILPYVFYTACRKT